MARLFGTDGVRGVANIELTPELAFRLGQAAARFLGPLLVVGEDTRASGAMLEAGVIAGATSSGATVMRAGIIPTPAVALLARQFAASGGIVISASHNPPEYNGIKFFDAQGYKLPMALEDEIEAFLHEPADGSDAIIRRPHGGAVGRVIEIPDACERYIDHAVAIVEEQGIRFDGIEVALDCAHGAASRTTAEALRRLGADLTVINGSWDGTDINVQCGSTHLGSIGRLVRVTRSQVGLAHDGDADRLLAIDENGDPIDGDVIEAICAVDLARQGKLPGRRVVSTVMCNLGFTRAMEREGIVVEQTAVGDRHVLERMRETGAVLGGEQSGHLIFLDHNSTGDGLITALQLLTAMRRADASLSELSRVMRRYPQVLVNVRVADRESYAGNESVARVVDSVSRRLGEEGRVLVRASGTEPLVRVMVEATSEYDAAVCANEIAQVVVEQLSGTVV